MNNLSKASLTHVFLGGRKGVVSGEAAQSRGKAQPSCKQCVRTVLWSLSWWRKNAKPQARGGRGTAFQVFEVIFCEESPSPTMGQLCQALLPLPSSALLTLQKHRLIILASRAAVYGLAAGNRVKCWKINARD